MRERSYFRPTLSGRVLGVAAVVVLVAAAARATWELLAPLVPVLAVLLGLAAVYRIIFGGFRR